MKANGKVLRLKEGYNPNSSSVGSAIPAFLLAASSAGIVAMLLLNAAETIRQKRKAGSALEPVGEAEESSDG